MLRLWPSDQTLLIKHLSFALLAMFDRLARALLMTKSANTVSSGLLTGVNPGVTRWCDRMDLDKRSNIVAKDLRFALQEVFNRLAILQNLVYALFFAFVKQKMFLNVFKIIAKQILLVKMLVKCPANV